jgi:peptidoglycan/LPS O-acetylase OafA/YrhL
VSRRLLLLGVASLLCCAALLAIAILLVGGFGDVERRILGSAMLLAGYGLVALPSVVLLDQRRRRGLAVVGLVLAAVAAGIALVSVWAFSDSDTVGRSVGTATVLALAGAEASALTARRGAADPRAVQWLYPVACAAGALTALAASVLLWTQPQAGIYPRLLGALLVLDLLLVALQPVLAHAHERPRKPLGI